MSHQIRLTFSSGGPLDTASALRFQTQYGQLPFEIFGSTETGGIAYRQQESALSPWTPLPAVSIDADEDHRLLLKSRYEGSNQWILADDVIELLPNEQFLLKGRIDRIIKIEEKRVSLTMIERLIGEFIAPLHCKVVDFELNDRTLIGCVIQHNSHIDELSRPQLSALKQHLSEHLERIAIPKRFRYVDQFPINPQGKIEFALLRDLMLAEVCDV